MQSSHTIKRSTALHVPGEPELWILILADLVIFSIFFIVFMHNGTLNAELFNNTKVELNQLLGLTNTVVLLTSSWFVVTGFWFIRANQLKAAKRFYCLAFAMGWVFFVIKIFEYTEKFSAGVNVSDNIFYLYYFSFTGVHLLHVTIGMLCLLSIIRRCDKASISHNDFVFTESVGVYWHLVDVLWIFLFCLIYLIKF